MIADLCRSGTSLNVFAVNNYRHNKFGTLIGASFSEKQLGNLGSGLPSFRFERLVYYFQDGTCRREHSDLFTLLFHEV